MGGGFVSLDAGGVWVGICEPFDDMVDGGVIL